MSVELCSSGVRVWSAQHSSQPRSHGRAMVTNSRSRCRSLAFTTSNWYSNMMTAASMVHAARPSSFAHASWGEATAPAAKAKETAAWNAATVSAVHRTCYTRGYTSATTHWLEPEALGVSLLRSHVWGVPPWALASGSTPRWLAPKELCSLASVQASRVVMSSLTAGLCVLCRVGPIAII